MRKALVVVLLGIVAMIVLGGSSEARKSPALHHVRAYTKRDGTQVGAYEAGSGSRSRSYVSHGSGDGYSTPVSAPAPTYQEPSYAAPATPASSESLAPVEVTATANADPGTMPATGGNPWLVALSGLTIACSAFALRGMVPA